MNFWNKIKAILFGGWTGKGQDENGSSQSSEIVHKIVQMLEMTQEEEYSCAEVYALLDKYVEGIERGEDVAQLMPLVKHHLDMCSDCREEFEALLRILEAGPRSA